MAFKIREYFVNKNKPPAGGNRVHILPLPSNCKPVTELKNRISLGKFSNMDKAVSAAKVDYPSAVACGNCKKAERGLLSMRNHKVNIILIAALALAAYLFYKPASNENCLKAELDVPLHIAACEGDMTAVKRLLKQDVDVNEVGKKHDWRVINAAIRGGNIDIVKLLIENGADVFAKIDGANALFSAARYGHIHIAKLLIDEGVDVYARHETGTTVLHSAAYGGHVDMAKFLLDMGLNVHAKTNRKSGEFTVLHNATHSEEHEHVEMVKFLVANGVDVNAENSLILEADRGFTALDYAGALGKDKIVAYLKSVNAKHSERYEPGFRLW